MNQDNFVSIIIPVLNEEKVISKCLAAINNLSTSKKKYEIIVVDNGSTDSTVEIVRKFHARVIQNDSESKDNISAARNLGAKHSRGDLLAFVDADCIVSENWLNSAFRHFDRSQVCAVGHKYSLPENPTWIERAWDSLFKEKEEKDEVDWLPAGNFFISKSLFESIGGFDESLVTNEDVDLCYRLRKKGHRILSDPAVRVIHLGNPQTCYQLYKKELWHGKGAFQVFFRDILSIRNVRPVIFALFYVLCLSGSLLTFMVFLFTQHLIPLLMSMTFIMASVIAPLALSIKTMSLRKDYRLIAGRTIVYLIYGIARASCLLKVLTSKKYKYK